VEGAGPGKGFQRLDEGRLNRAGREIHGKVGAPKPLMRQTGVDRLAVRGCRLYRR